MRILNRDQARHILTRLSLAVIFIGIGIWEILSPSYWSYYIPKFLANFANPLTLTMIHGVILVVLGLAVLIGAYLRTASILSALMMLSILVALITMFGFTDIMIRDLAVLLVAIALYFDDTQYLRINNK